MKNVISLVLCAVLVSVGCRAENARHDMRSSEEAWNRRAGKELVIYMDLEALFPNSRVRELAKAAENGDLQEVNKLAAEGVDVDYKGTENATPLFWALKNYDGFVRLLELGANPNVVIDDAYSVIHLAAKNEDARFLEAALRHGGDPNVSAGQLNETPLFDAIGNLEAIKLLISAGANVDAKLTGTTAITRPSSGNTAVMEAASLAEFETVYLLLENGASYQIKNINGKTLVDRLVALHGALDRRSDEYAWYRKVISWLEERGVKVKNIDQEE